MQMYEGVRTGLPSENCGGAAHGQCTEEAHGSGQRVSARGRNVSPFCRQEGGPEDFSGGA